MILRKKWLFILALVVASVFSVSASVISQQNDGDGDEKDDKAQVCWCTNVGGVSVICAECDGEPKMNACQNHDDACKASAKAGGIREWEKFFCTTGTGG